MKKLIAIVSSDTVALVLLTLNLILAVTNLVAGNYLTSCINACIATGLASTMKN